MYRGNFYTSADFLLPQAEDNLKVLWGDYLEGRWHYDEFRVSGDLRHLLCSERLEPRLPRTEVQRLVIVKDLKEREWHDAEEIVLFPQAVEQWQQEVRATLKRLKKPPELETGFITQTWFLRRDELDEVWLGLGYSKWLFINWFSTV